MKTKQQIQATLDRLGFWNVKMETLDMTLEIMLLQAERIQKSENAAPLMQEIGADTSDIKCHRTHKLLKWIRNIAETLHTD